MRTPLILLLGMLSAACAERATYEMIQENNRWKCHELPPSEYEQCIERSNKPYGQYENERQQL